MEEKGVARWKALNGNILKIIAIVTMMIDHIGAGIIEVKILGISDNTNWEAIFNSPELMGWMQIDMFMRLIGRISFPIFCFLLVEGFLHTRNVKKYALRLLAFSLISEIPFDLVFRGSWFEVGYQNVFFTLFLGLLALIAMERFRESFWKQAGAMALCCAAAIFLKTDYSAFGVFFVVVLYLLRYNHVMQTVLGSVFLLWEPTAILAFIPIRMYNGTRGKWNLKYIFYAFYPAHLLVIAVIQRFLFR